MSSYYMSSYYVAGDRPGVVIALRYQGAAEIDEVRLLLYEVSDFGAVGEGPTGLLLTTTKIKLHPENETRLFSIPVSDSPEQTAAILEANGRGDEAEPVPCEFIAFQAWLATVEHRVAIPFGEKLGRAIPPKAVRLRRDVPALFALVKAHTMLHQESRQRDAEGCIVATLDDYAAPRELVADLIAEGVGASVSPTMRETVQRFERL